jgi:hypothetical protein
VKLCSVKGCGRRSRRNGLCIAHASRLAQNGNLYPEIPIGRLKKYKAEDNGHWMGGEIIKRGRVLIYTPSHPHPNHAGVYVYRYRLNIEKFLGRYLKPGEFVHHVNGNQSDDRLENLKVMSRVEHSKMTALEKWQVPEYRKKRREGNKRYWEECRKLRGAQS